MKTWISVGLLGALATACGGDEEGLFGGPSGTGGSSNGTASGPSIAELPQALTTIFCDAFETCVGPMAKLQFGEQSCEDVFGKTLEDGEFAHLQSAVDDGKVTYNQGNAQACLDAMKAQGCELFTNRTVDECLDTIVGTVDENGPCTLDFECTGDLFCKADGACPGACTALQPAGTECTDSDECMNGLVCDDNLDICAAPLGVGESCDDTTANCAMSLGCWGSDEQAGTPGTCMTNDSLFALETGASCDIQTGELCAVDTFCALEVDMQAQKLVGTCEPAVASGAACKTSFPDQCPANEYCKTPPQQPQQAPDLNGVCTPTPVAGEACLGQQVWAAKCVAGTACVDGTCEAIARLGESCSGDDACASETCEGNICVAPLACE